MKEVIGRCIGETTLGYVSFVSKEMPKVGEYVSLNYDNKNVLGMIEALVRGSVSINDDIYDPKTIERIREIEGDDHYVKGKVRILGDIDNDLRIPRTPAPPGTEIKTADCEVLKEIFHVDKYGLKLGNLITQEEVEIEVDINKMVTRHLAVLAMTGAGKSNTVSVIVDGLLKVNGSVLICDMHSEYVNTDFGEDKVNIIKPEINPLYLSFSEIKKLSNIPPNAYVQERYFRKAYKLAKKTLMNGSRGKDFIALILSQLESWILEVDADSSEDKSNSSVNASDRKSITDVLNKVEHMHEMYGNILNMESRDIIDNLEIGKANILDLGSVDEFASDVVVSHVLRNVLSSRKEFLRTKDGLSFPIFSIIEEAHILAPQNRKTESKNWISRIAREGRKFGVGLCLVSQSPKSLDSDALSQANNMIILRLVEPTDQNHVQRASESLSDDLISQLPSLNIGEAIVLGLMTRIPTLVKIDEFKGKISGGDLNIVEEWSKSLKHKKEILEEQKREYEDLGGDY